MTQMESLEKILTAEEVEIAPHGAMVECRLTPEGDEIAKILSLKHWAGIESFEALENEISVNGIVVLDLLYCNTDGAINSTKSTYPFSTIVPAEGVTPNSKVMLNVVVDNCSVELSDGNLIKAICSIIINGFSYNDAEVPVFVDSNLEYQTKYSTILTTNIAYALRECFDVSGELALTGDIKRVLATDVNLIQKSFTAGQNFVTVSGEAIVDVLYLEGETINGLQTATLTLPYKEEIEMNGVSAEMLVQVFSRVRKDKLQVELDAGEDRATVKIVFPICSNIFAFNVTEVNAIEDLYSLTNKTLLSTQSYSRLVDFNEQYSENKVDGTINVSEDAPRIDKILNYSIKEFKVLQNGKIDDDFVLQGIITANVVYLNDEDNQVYSVESELPFEVVESSKNIASDDIVNVDCCLADVRAVCKKGREIYFDAKIKSYIQSHKTTVNAVLSKAEKIDELPVSNHALEIYFAKNGQTLWDIAKDMNEEIDLINSQNPELPEVFEGTEKIVVYKQKEAQFD